MNLSRMTPLPGAGLRVLREGFLLFLLALLAGVATALFHPRAPGYAEGRPEAGAIHLSQIPDPVLWVDARSRRDFEDGHIPGAILLNEDDWDDHLMEFFEVWDPDVPVVVYCGAEACLSSKAVADRLRRELDGVGTFLYLSGGWEEWRRAHP